MQQSKTITGLLAKYDETKMYLEGTVTENGIPKSTIWSKEGMNLEFPEWDLVSYREKEQQLRDALTNPNTKG